MLRPEDRSFGFELQLGRDESSRQVVATLVPSFKPVVFSRQFLQAALRALEFEAYFIFDERIDELCAAEADLRDKGQKIHAELLKRLEKARKSTEPAAVTRARTDDRLEAPPRGPDMDGDSSTAGRIAPSLAGADTDAECAGTVAAEADPPQITAGEVFRLLRQGAMSFVLAEQRDAEVLVTISEDELSAFLTLRRPYGGQPADREMVAAELRAKGVSAPLQEEAINTALAAGQCENRLVAVGQAPQKGRDSTFRALVEDQVSRGPVIDDKGVANYRDINQFVVVDKGHKLMRREAPAPGKAGMDVFGRVIPAQTGEWLPFFGGIEGAEVAPDDVNLLIASQKGHPIIHPRGVSVDPVLQLTNVSLATGNVNYDGSVFVKEDVADGLRIEATGDVIVDGVVGKATIVAGNDVIIRQGLIGGVPAEEGSAEARSEERFGASITAEGSVSAHFATMTRIRAGKSINISEYASHCDLFARESIVIGGKSAKGSLIGGRAQAFDLVSARFLGSVGSPLTVIRVGAEPDTTDRFRQVAQNTRVRRERIQLLREELEKVRLRAQLTEPTAQMLEKIEALGRELTQLEKEVRNLQSDEDGLKVLLINSKKSRVVARQRVFQNVVVHILGSSLRIKDDSGQGSFYFDVRQVRFKQH